MLMLIVVIAVLLHWGIGFVHAGDWTGLLHGVITLLAVSSLYLLRRPPGTWRPDRPDYQRL
jgi:copper oxidase (laccase) domain-containing protein